jgi:hypothetical protein
VRWEIYYLITPKGGIEYYEHFFFIGGGRHEFDRSLAPRRPTTTACPKLEKSRWGKRGEGRMSTTKDGRVKSVATQCG